MLSLFQPRTAGVIKNVDAPLVVVLTSVRTPEPGVGSVPSDLLASFDLEVESVYKITYAGALIATFKSENVLPGVGINASQTVLSVGAIGVGVTIVHKAVDFSNAGLSTNRMMVLPKVNGTGGLQNPVSGAVVYNTSSNKVQVYNGSTWKTVQFE